MITNWCVGNFKSFRDETAFNLTPLTILAGANSSGKSTVIQSILLVTQTLESKVASRPVVLNAHLAKLGSFSDIRHNNSDNTRVLIRWTMEPQHLSTEYRSNSVSAASRRFPYVFADPEQLQRVTCEITFDYDASNPQRELSQLSPRLLSCKVSATSSTDSPEGQESHLEIRRSKRSFKQRLTSFHLNNGDSESALSSLTFEIADIDNDSKEFLKEDRPGAKLAGCILQHFLPVQPTVVYDESRERAHILASLVCGTEQLRRYRIAAEAQDGTSVPPAVLDRALKKIGSERADRFRRSAEAPRPTVGAVGDIGIQPWLAWLSRLTPRERADIRHLLTEERGSIESLIYAGLPVKYRIAPARVQALSIPIYYVDSYFSEAVKYLGPLRDEPKAIYPLEVAIDPTDIGLRGEYTAAVLEIHKDKQMTYVPSSNFAEPRIESTVIPTSLKLAVVDWLNYLGVAYDIATTDRGRFGIEFQVKTEESGVAHDLTHVGVGVSQVLPIVVMCLLADPDSVLIFEQPELHLHPKVQSRLADFFVSMALQGKQCIIETHSEHMINRLRYRIAAASAETIGKLITVYFFEKKGNATKCRTVSINRFGAISDWPDGFFDEAERSIEGLVLAAEEKLDDERGIHDAANRD